MCGTKRPQSCHCFAEPIYSLFCASKRGLACYRIPFIGKLSRLILENSIYFADGCDLLLATSTFVFAFLHPVLLVFSCCPHMVSNSRCIASQVLLKRLPSHPLPNIFGGNFGVSGGDHAPSLRFAQLENLSSVFLLWVFATASRHVEGSLKSLPACSFVYPSSSARPFCVFFLLPRCNWQDRSLQTVSLALMGYHLHRVF